MLRAMHCKILGTSLQQSIKNLQNTTMNKKAPLATSYHKVLQSITKYYNVLVVLLRISPYYKVPLRTPIYEEMLCTTRYYNVVVYSVLQSIKTYYKLLLRTPKYNYVFKRSLGVKLPNMEG